MLYFIRSSGKTRRVDALLTYYLKCGGRGECRAQEGELVPQLAHLRLRARQPRARGLGVGLGRLAGGARLVQQGVLLLRALPAALLLRLRVRVRVGLGLGLGLGLRQG